MDIRTKMVMLARHISQVYKEYVEDERFYSIENVIKQFENYIDDQSDDWGKLYDIVQGDEGIWEYSEFDDDLMSVKEQEMWGLEVCVLSCFIKLEISCMGDVSPQDMEMQEENIPLYIDYVEQNFQKVDGIKKCKEYWRKFICY